MKKNRQGYVTLEMIVGSVVIAIPLLLAISEVYRFEHRARKTLFAGQQQCLLAAAQASGRSSYQVLPVTVSGDVELLTFTKRYFGIEGSDSRRHLSRTYYIGTGTGRE